MKIVSEARFGDWAKEELELWSTSPPQKGKGGSRGGARLGWVCSSTLSLSLSLRVWNLCWGTRCAGAEQKAGCWALACSVAAVGTGSPCAVTLLGPRCCGTRIEGFSVEVPGLTQIPREGPIRQKFLLPCPATGGVCFAGEDVLHRVFYKGQRRQRRWKMFHSTLAWTEAGLLFQPGFSPLQI